jgi:hypothetical protein
MHYLLPTEFCSVLFSLASSCLSHTPLDLSASLTAHESHSDPFFFFFFLLQSHTFSSQQRRRPHSSSFSLRCGSHGEEEDDGGDGVLVLRSEQSGEDSNRRVFVLLFAPNRSKHVMH